MDNAELLNIAITASNCTLAAVDRKSVSLRDDTYPVAQAAWAALLEQIRDQWPGLPQFKEEK